MRSATCRIVLVSTASAPGRIDRMGPGFYNLPRIPLTNFPFTMPPMATDAHCPVFGPAVPFPYAPGRAYTPPDAPKQQLAERHEVLGIDRAVIIQASFHDTDNRAMVDAVAVPGGFCR